MPDLKKKEDKTRHGWEIVYLFLINARETKIDRDRERERERGEQVLLKGNWNITKKKKKKENSFGMASRRNDRTIRPTIV